MNKKLMLIAVLGLSAIASQASDFTLVTNWARSGYTWNGTAGGVDVALTFSGTTGSLVNDNLSGSSYSAFPGPSSARMLNYGTTNMWTLTLSKPSAVLLYAKYWRGIGTAGSNPGIFEFDRSFTITSGLGGATIVGNDLHLPSGYADGILAFSWPISSLSGSAIPGDRNDAQEFTFAVTSIPEPTTWAILGAGALGLLALRRRRS